MKTALTSPSTPASSISPASPDSPAPTAHSTSSGPAAAGRPSGLTKEMIGLLCTIIRETGASDSAAAARAALHPSTVSRWKRDNLDFAILLRAAREDFRITQLEIIQREAAAGRATSWRAAAWMLERIFPEDYAPRARERAQFQEQFEARAAREVEGEEIALPDGEEPLQNVQNSPELAPEAMPCAEEVPASGLAEIRHLGGPLQNVQNAPLASSEDRRATSGRS